jgi:hypothetical protein
MSHRALTITLTLLVAIIGFSSTSSTQEEALGKKDVPKVILDAFHKSYPKATIKGYSRESDQGNVSYEIESIEAKTHRDISYTADGSVIAIEESLTYLDLPEPIRSAITKEYPSAKVLTCERVIKRSTTQFELLVRSGNQKHELVFNADGSLVKKEKK